MKNHELLDMIGDVNEDYVQAADSNMARPRFGWKAIAACAACLFLAAAAYVLPRGGQLWSGRDASQGPARPLIQTPGLHDYILVEQDIRIVTTQGDSSVPGGIANAPQPDPAPGGGFQGEHTASPSGQDEDASVSEEAAAQYDRLLLWMLGADQPGPSPDYPEWFGGAWLDGAHLTVAIADSFHTPGLEAQITAACGGTGEVLFADVKYSQAYLEGLMDEVCAVFDQYGWISSVIDANEMTNRVELEFFGVPSDAVLAELARLDPEGDAIFIQVFYSGRILPTTQSGKDPAPGESLSEHTPLPPAPNEERAEPAVDPEPFPTPIDGSDYQPETGTLPEEPAGALPARTEDGYDIPGAAGELPQAKYDATAEGE